ncbi:hypothetical protein BsIDN1_46520 [Bacillus safensis]|uniref:Transcriptional regulator LacI/GalR-like sensor domain-containing protein n=1 Tax=Bacillus safensis TaxID=561879 RepID=A0A5S9MFW7_BACIA|nr:hypothetical protein BsIDN1_46520 [Bacillus safensis]
MGLEVASVCSEIGLSIPDDLSIIGQDNSYIAQKNAHVKLTTLTHPQEQMGRDAADWMIKKFKGKRISLIKRFTSLNWFQVKRSNE